MTTLSVAELNDAGRVRFVAAMSGIFEHSDWIVERAHARAPFASQAGLLAALGEVVRAADEAAKLALIGAHPDLAGKFGVADAMTAHSQAEQAGAGLDRLGTAEFARFQALNRAYRERFGFPFVICVRRHTRASILRQFERRLARGRPEEIGAAVEEILRIAALRLAERTQPDGSLRLDGRLSTHVLDTHSGVPAQGAAVELFELDAEGASRVIASAVTNADGRTDAPLISSRPIPIGAYELRFAVGAYFAAKAAPLADPPFLEVVAVRFSVAEPEGRYHVPLLVTPWSYATYRGS